MASSTEIANAALIKLGAARITELTDDNDRARTLNARYTEVLKAELRRHRWRFSIARTTLPALTSTPDFGYDLKYQLPGDYVSLITIGDFDVSLDLSDYRSAPISLYSIEGGELLTNLSAPLSIRYAKLVTDVSLMDSAFKEAFASRLAWECSERITQDTKKRQLAASEYKDAIREALRANAIETALEYMSDDSWIMSRTR